MSSNGQGHRPVALITGAARRIGATIARRLHAAGYDLALHFRNSRADLDALIADLERERAASTLALHAELDDTGQLAPMVEAVRTRFGRLDALVNNASAFYATPIATATSAQWDELFGANARAPFFLAQAAAPHLAERRGAIVNIVDIYAERPLPGYGIYCMSKAALAMMTQALARDLAPAVRVNGVAPGAILWPESGKSYADQQQVIERTPLKRTGTPDDIAATVLWLLRDAPFVTGEIVRVDGGRHLTF
ncbi:MAG TPA: pteridine reductase [Rhodanobacteraceae bacterium]|jgi:pteridine reductase|nr:pteridine reductase [Rhodanobacteraceae bacterium]